MHVIVNEGKVRDSGIAIAAEQSVALDRAGITVFS